MIHGFFNGQDLRLSQPKIAADTIDYLEAVFKFQTADWNGLEKWAHFQKGDVVYDVMLEDDKISKEKHLNLFAGYWSVYLHGNAFENGKMVQRITTDKARLSVEESGVLDGDPLPLVPPSVGEQLDARITALEKGGGGGTGGDTPGEDGEDGGYYIPSVSAEGVLSWSASKEDMPPIESSVVKGDKGETGATGATGPAGLNGTDGEDGVSPTITVTEIAGGHRLTITDVNGTKTVDVMDGEDGDSGAAGETVTVVQTTGDSETDVMSQAAVTAEIDRVDILKRDTSDWSPVNVTDGIEWDAEGTYWGSAGNKTTTTIKYRAAMSLIPAEPNCDYNTVGFVGTIRIYDANKAHIEDRSTTAISNQLTFTTTENAAYFGIAYRYDALTTDALVGNIKLMRNTMTEDDYNNLPVRADVLKAMHGKTVVCFGDSLFGMYRGDTSAPAYVERVTGATVYNVGFGGCRMSVHPTSGYAAFSMWALAKAVAENDWTTQDAQATSGSSYFPDQLAILKGINFNDVDSVVIHYGTNDFMGSVDIGKESAATVTTTICGALRYSVETLLTAFPHLRIFISLPVFRFWTADDGTVTYSDAYTNGDGNTLVQVVSAIAAVAREYNLPVIDGYHGLGINKQNAANYLSDGVHHNEDGRKRFGEYIGNCLISEQNVFTTEMTGGVSEDRVNELISEAITGAIGGNY